MTRAIVFLKSALWRAFRKHNRGEAAALSVFTAALVFTWLGRPTRRWPDTPSYLHVDFLGHTGRLWTVPLVFDLAGRDSVRTAVQLGIATLCWGLCAVVLRRSVANVVVGWVLFATVVGLAVSRTVAQWHRVILSESITISLTVLALAVWVRAMQARSARWWTAAAAVTVLWTFARQVNVPVTAMVAVAVASAAWWMTRKRVALAVAGVLVAATAWAAFDTAQSTELRRFNASEIVADRVLRSPSAASYFTARGMPVTDEERLLAGTFRRTETIDVFLGDRRLQSWIDRRFNSTYASYLITHPKPLVAAPLSHALTFLGSRAQYAKPRAILPSGVDALLYGRRQLVGLIVLASIAFAARLVVVRVALDPLETIAVATLIGSIVWAWLVWLLATVDLRRLGTPPGVAMRIALLTIAAASADRLLARRSARITG